MYENASQGNFAADSKLPDADILHFELFEERDVLEKEQRMSEIMILWWLPRTSSFNLPPPASYVLILKKLVFFS